MYYNFSAEEKFNRPKEFHSKDNYFYEVAKQFEILLLLINKYFKKQKN